VHWRSPNRFSRLINYALLPVVLFPPCFLLGPLLSTAHLSSSAPSSASSQSALCFLIYSAPCYFLSPVAVALVRESHTSTAEYCGGYASEKWGCWLALELLKRRLPCTGCSRWAV